jgi:hypothetical protein
MAPFNKRQIGYIQAVAGRQQHTTLKCGQLDSVISSKDDVPTFQQARTLRKVIGCGLTSPDADAKSLLIHHWSLDGSIMCHDSRQDHNDATLSAQDVTGWGHYVGCGGLMNTLTCFNAKCAQNTYVGPNADVDSTLATKINETRINSWERATPDGYLRSTDLRFRFTLPTNVPQVSWDQVKDSFNHAINLASSTGGISTTGVGTTGAANLQWWEQAYNLYMKGTFDTNDPTLKAITAAQFNDSAYSDDDRGRWTDDARTHIREAIEAARQNKPMGQDHYEFRWIVWRHKRPTVSTYAPGEEGSGTNLEAIRDGASFRNPNYDLFVGQTGRKRGFVGFTGHPRLDSSNPYNLENPASEYYSGEYWNGIGWINGGGTADSRGSEKFPYGEAGMTVDDLMTARLNRDDYVVMKDVRFFLGKEHGKSHFEDTLHWDWNDPIETNQENVLTSPTLNNKNFRWMMTLIGTSNGKSPVILNQHVRWTTKMESG